MPPRKGLLRRKRSIRGPARLIVVICGGRVTEPSYFHGLVRQFRKATVQIQISGDGVDPVRLVKSAINRKESLLRDARKQKNSFDKNFEIWVIFDSDEFENIAEARKLAETNEILAAQSNPCFEVWGIYHFQDYHSPDNARDCQKHLTDICDVYNCRSNKLFDFEQLADSAEARLEMLDNACNRGRDGLAKRAEEGAANGPPSSEVFRLAEVIKNL